MKSQHIFLCVVAALLVLPLVQAFGESPVTFEIFTTFNYPGASETLAIGINDDGDVAGFFTLPNYSAGFIRFRHHLSGPIIDPNDQRNTTRLNDISDAGTVCGNYQQTDFHWHSFLATGSVFTEVNTGALDTFAYGVNDAGNTCGYTGNPSGAFVIIDGTMGSISVPGAVDITPVDINNLNQVVGFYNTGTRTFGFRRDADGTLTYPIAAPGADSTYLLGINDKGWMTGFVSDSAGYQHGIFFQSLGNSAVYDYPGADNTAFFGINSRGLISGGYGNASGSSNFIARVRPAAEDFSTK
jgi:hypothetical protein